MSANNRCTDCGAALYDVPHYYRRCRECYALERARERPLTRGEEALLLAGAASEGAPRQVDTELPDKRLELRRLAVVELDLEMSFEILGVGGDFGFALNLCTQELHALVLKSVPKLFGAFQRRVDACRLPPRQHRLTRVRARIEQHV